MHSCKLCYRTQSAYDGHCCKSYAHAILWPPGFKASIISVSHAYIVVLPLFPCSSHWHTDQPNGNDFAPFLQVLRDKARVEAEEAQRGWGGMGWDQQCSTAWYPCKQELVSMYAEGVVR
jgi:hypothetical protein